MISFQPRGGLGNQLFSWSLALRLAMDHETDLFAVSGHYSVNHEFTFELNSFDSGLTGVFETVGDLEESMSLGNPRFSPRYRRRLLPTYSERSFLFDREALQVGDNTNLKGYFQSWKYFHPRAEIIRSRIQCLREPSPWFLEQKSILDGVGCWIAIHVRRGDYLTNESMGLVDKNYYQRSLQLLGRVGFEGIPAYVFTDSLEPLEPGLFPDSWEVVQLARPPEESPPIESMLLLAGGSAIIMANSTFSWWAAYLGHRSSRPVIYPRPWLDNPAVDDRDLFYPEWIGVGR